MPETDVKMVVLRVMMHCEGCASTVKRAVKRIPGITSYQVDFPGQKVTVMGAVKPEEVFCQVAKTGNTPNSGPRNQRRWWQKRRKKKWINLKKRIRRRRRRLLKRERR
ncbi:hypothetical protein BDL97_05G144500 [Sphagnum fallax]|nr:hypothetical protein BDL97_05G144500 [Sphagnum fallax]